MLVSQPPHLKRQGHATLGYFVPSFSHKTDLRYDAYICQIRCNFPVVAALNCGDECAPKCEDGWEEKEGKCYYFSQDVLTWVEAEEECRSHGSHLASVTSQKADDFLAMKCKKGKSFWIGARQTFDSDNRGSWSWADGCSPWKYTSWGANFKPDNKSGYECALFREVFQKNLN